MELCLFSDPCVPLITPITPLHLYPPIPLIYVSRSTDGGNEFGFNFGVKFEVTHMSVKLMYEKELHFLFERMVNALVAVDKDVTGATTEASGASGASGAYTTESVGSVSVSNPTKPTNVDIATTAGLHLLYYWVSFAPLTRGSSAAGYTALYACILSQGVLIDPNVPHNMQLDWEAFFSSTPAEFVEKMKWIRHKPASAALKAWVSAKEEVPVDVGVDVGVGVAVSSIPPTTSTCV